MIPPTTLRLTAELTRRSLVAEPEAASPIDGAVVWSALVWCATSHRVAPLLTSEALAILPPSEEADAVRGLFGQMRDANRQRNRQLLDQVEQATLALNRIGIEPVILKGGARLVEGFYPDLGMRHLSDLDLLVPEPALPNAITALRALGYRGKTEPYSAGLDENAHHAAPLVPPGIGTRIELHRSVFQPRYAAFVPAGAALRRARWVRLGAARLGLLTPEDALVHSIAHGQLHHGRFAAGRLLLRELAEIALLARQDEEAVAAAFARAAALGHGTAFGSALLLVDRLLGTQITPVRARTRMAGLAASRAILQHEHVWAMQLGGILGRTAQRVRAGDIGLLLKRLCKREIYANQLDALRRDAMLVRPAAR